MKELIKKVAAVVCAASVAAMLTATGVFAVENMRSGPGQDTQTQTSMTNSQGEEAAGDAAPAESQTDTSSVTESAQQSNVANITQTTQEQTAVSKKYLTKTGGFLWFLLSVIVNAALSLWIGGRFYRLAKKEAQSSSEIRALRRDIEEKFASTLTDIAEPGVEVMNQNESYARDDEGLEMPERKKKIEITDEEREIFRRWDEKYEQKRKQQAAQTDDDDNDEQDYSDDRFSGRPAGIEFEDDDEEDYEEDTRRIPKPDMKKVAKVTDKAKKILGNVFPFED